MSEIRYKKIPFFSWVGLKIAVKNGFSSSMSFWHIAIFVISVAATSFSIWKEFKPVDVNDATSWFYQNYSGRLWVGLCALVAFLLYVIIRATKIKNRLEANLKLFHKKIAEEFRQYDTNKRNGLDVSSLKTLKEILQSFHNDYLVPIYGSEVSLCIKISVEGQLAALRFGEDCKDRVKGFEQNVAPNVYSLLSPKLKYIYVKNLNKLDTTEAGILGQSAENIRNAAEDNYNSFIALPVQTGMIRRPNSEVPKKDPIGMIGIDHKKAYTFGNFAQVDSHFLFGIVDLISIVANDAVEEIEEKLTSPDASKEFALL